ncbi:alpha/beta hydrolase family protein [Amycolatopsis orientalis]|uniref:alpha/beta hydrolase family protein n=1 Tax=Amycolatopsis orientalis TaxID=31958 RepID=UPI0006868119|nr:lipase [Amycolatopsis orientalis]
MSSRHTWVVRGSALLAGLTAAAGLATAAPAAAAEPVRFTTPAPTGDHAIGTTELHLVDSSRPDPWKPDRRRELMATVTYPADRHGDGPRAPWLSDAMADTLDDGLNSPAYLDVPPGSIDWTSAKRHARTGAPVSRWGGPRPVVVFSPGFTVPREFDTVLTDDLASRGYVVVSLSHTYESMAVEFPGGRIERAPQRELDPATMKTAIDARVADSRFVLDQLTLLAHGVNPDAGHRTLPRGLGRLLDLSRIGMFGHSYGGFTSGETMYHDRRVDAGINLDGAMASAFGFPEGTPYVPGEVVKHGLDRPFLLMGSELTDPVTGKPVEHTHANPYDRSWVEFWGNQRGWKRDLLLRGSAHMGYSDLQAVVPQLASLVKPEKVRALIGTIDPRRSVAAQRDYISAFFDLHLKGRDRHLFDRESPRHPDVGFID